MIYRMEKKRDYTVVNNGFLRDQTLSLKAKGLLAYMLSRPDDWQFSISGLSSQLMEGELAIKGTLKELMKCGYVQRERVQQPDGTFAYRYSVFEAKQTAASEVTQPQTPQHRPAAQREPQVKKAPEAKPYMGRPGVDAPHAENEPLINTHVPTVSLTEKPNTELPKESKADRPTFDDLLDRFCLEREGDGEVRRLLGEWLQLRKAKRAAMTNAVIDYNLSSLPAAAAGIGLAAYLKEVLRRGWTTFYPLTGGFFSAPQNTFAFAAPGTASPSAYGSNVPSAPNSGRSVSSAPGTFAPSAYGSNTPSAPNSGRSASSAPGTFAPSAYGSNTPAAPNSGRSMSSAPVCSHPRTPAADLDSRTYTEEDFACLYAF